MGENMKINIASLQKTVYGRHAFTKDGGLLISWNLSGFAVRFSGTQICVHFGHTLPEGESVHVRADIDGELWGYESAQNGGVLRIDALADGEHTLVFRRVGGSVSTLEVSEVEVDDAADILLPPLMPSLRMEFIGDSITYGYGLLRESCAGFLADTDGDGSGTYAYLTAKALGADIRTEAISGQGIVCKYDGEHGTPIPDFFEYDDAQLSLPHDFSSWVPDIVVINAGTNDSLGGVCAEDFCIGVAGFLDRIREVYPDAEVFYAYGIMGDVYAPQLSALIAQRAKTDRKLHFVVLEPISEEETGVNAHPNLIGHERAARALTEAIRAII